MSESSEEPPIVNQNRGSFRDPSGFVFYRNGSILRQINNTYREHYDHLIASGLYKALVDAGLLIPHVDMETRADSGTVYKVIQPELIPFISYPYEWSFSQLKHAALATLEIQNTALKFGMSLKDSSAYNIQFRRGKPILIDTLSFEKHGDGNPWIAYKQFCQHFLAPLALMSYRDVRLSQLLRVHLDGIPLDLASSLLPAHAYLHFSLLSHVYLHAKTQKHFASKAPPRQRMSRLALLGLIDSLESLAGSLKWRPRKSVWTQYDKECNYSTTAFQHKQEIVSKYLESVKPKSVWDLGANTGQFSRIASNRGIPTVSFDMDPGCVEKNYIECTANHETNLLPLVLDLTNPSPGIGWQNEERMTLAERGPAEAVLALALIHHLVISANLPMNRIAEFLSRICRFLIIEFVPKADTQVQRLLATRQDTFPGYTQENFEADFSKYFVKRNIVRITESQRFLYLMERKGD